MRRLPALVTLLLLSPALAAQPDLGPKERYVKTPAEQKAHERWWKMKYTGKLPEEAFPIRSDFEAKLTGKTMDEVVKVLGKADALVVNGGWPPRDNQNWLMLSYRMPLYHEKNPGTGRITLPPGPRIIFVRDPLKDRKIGAKNTNTFKVKWSEKNAP